jgi:hypothetical protein
LALSLLALPSPARASSIVIAGSSYDYALFGTVTPLLIGTATFDGVAESFSYHGVSMTISETETDLGGGTYQIIVQLIAASDVFPTVGESGLFNLGVAANPLDLASSTLTSARMSFFNSGGMFASDEFIGAVANTSPWDGFFPSSGVGAGFIGAGGRGTNRIDLVLTLNQVQTPVPEPATFALLALGLAGLGVRRWRQRKA